MRGEQIMDNFVSIQLHKTGQPLYLELAHEIERLLPSLPADERLWTVRALAKQAGVNTSTVVAAYRYLEECGLVYTKPGSGTYRMPREASLLDSFEDTPGRDSYSRAAAQGGMINLTGNSLSPDFFPVEEFKRAVSRVLDRDGGTAFSYQDSEGYFPLREQVRVFVRDHYGIACSTQDILLTSGAQQAVDIVAKSLLAPSDVVIAENPSYVGMKSLFTMYGAKILGVPLEEDGVNVDMIEAYAKRYNPKLVYTMPVYQTPTGVTLSPDKRRRLLALARQQDFYIVEDDLYSDVSLKGERIPPLKSEDTDGRVLYVKSFSKLLMPGVRVGFLIVPERLRSRVSGAKYATDIVGAGFLQRALCEFIEQGALRTHLDALTGRYRALYAAGRERVRAFRRYGVTVRMPGGGYGFWLTLPEQMNDQDAYEFCKARGVVIAPGRSFYLSPMLGDTRHIRLGFCSSDRVQEGYAVLEAYFAQHAPSM